MRYVSVLVVVALILLSSAGESYAERRHVYFKFAEEAGTIVVVLKTRYLYYVLGDGTAYEYPVAIGRTGTLWAGDKYVGRKAEWPTWTPPEAMIARKPELAEWALGMPGGLENPLGARALYLEGTLYRIHGTNDDASIGEAVSSGCFRMFNEDVIELYDLVEIGALVRVVLTLKSLRHETETLSGGLY